MSHDSQQITVWLQRMAEGESKAEERVYQLLRQELARYAHFFMSKQGANHTLQATALVNEVYLRIFGQNGTPWENRQHFLGVAAKAMRSILIDHARGKNRLKRLPPGERVALATAEQKPETPALDLIALDEALDRLQENDPLAAQVVEQRWYLGLPMQEVSDLLEVPLRTVERKWRLARAFLHKELS